MTKPVDFQGLERLLARILAVGGGANARGDGAPVVRGTAFGG